MSLTRRALTLLATGALLPAGSASAAMSTLTPSPPPTFSEPSSSSISGTTTTAETSTTAGSGAIPRTGSDLPEELLVAGTLIAAGAVLRLRRPS
jgi:hypothetical protein